MNGRVSAKRDTTMLPKNAAGDKEIDAPDESNAKFANFSRRSIKLPPRTTGAVVVHGSTASFH
jgi:hypothetical protein